MQNISPATARKATDLATNAMINEGGAVQQPTKEESEATLDHAIHERNSAKARRPAKGLNQNH